MQQKKMRVAIQLYGHLRSFEDTYQSLFRYVIEPNHEYGIEFDIFIHTWDEFDAVQKMPAQYNKDMKYAGLKISEVIKDKVASFYHPKSLLIESQIQLTESQLNVVTENNYNLAFCQSFRNGTHTFCAANRLRQDYEKANNIGYDLVLVTRPDIVFFRPLNLGAFFSKERCWQFFGDDDLKQYVFSTYINGAHAVICPDKYIAGLDLVLLAIPSVCNKLAEWEDLYDTIINQWPEHALIHMMKRHGLRHSYLVYEKDKCWTIRRIGAPKPNLINKMVNYLYFKMLPILLKSKLFCQHTYTNTTTMASLGEYQEYLLHHLDLKTYFLVQRVWNRLKRYIK